MVRSRAAAEAATGPSAPRAIPGGSTIDPLHLILPRGVSYAALPACCREAAGESVRGGGTAGGGALGQRLWQAAATADGTAAAAAGGARAVVPLSGYERLQLLRAETSAFRRDYLNWRQQRPRGARGEPRDIVGGRRGRAAAARTPKPVTTAGAAVGATAGAASASGSAEGNGAHAAFGSGAPFLRPASTAPGGAPLSEPPSMEAVGGPSLASSSTSTLGRHTSGTASSVSVFSTGDAEDFEVGGEAPDGEERRWLRFYFNPFVPSRAAVAKPLNAALLAELRAGSASSGLTVPPYSRDPSTVKNWIMHLGVGGFHRSHQLVYMDELLTAACVGAGAASVAGEKPPAGRRHEQPAAGQPQPPGSRPAGPPKAADSHRCRRRRHQCPAPRVEGGGGSGPGIARAAAGAPAAAAASAAAGGAAGAASPILREKWGYVGVGLLPNDVDMKKALESQDLLYIFVTGAAKQKSVPFYCGTLPASRIRESCIQSLFPQVLERSNSVSAARVVGSMFEYLYAPDDPARALARLGDPNLRIVSLTVTEKGYCQSVNGALQTQLPAVAHDIDFLRDWLASAGGAGGGDAAGGRLRSDFLETQKSAAAGAAKALAQPAPPSAALAAAGCQGAGGAAAGGASAGGRGAVPRSALGFICWGLLARRRQSVSPFTVLSCDNLPENGHVARRMVCAMAAAVDAEFARWVEAAVAFPCTMVDRITPVTGAEHRDILEKDFGLVDRWPVVTESFRQWVVEDSFPAGRPPWEDVGALLCADVRPFELMKLRLLNGGHSTLSYAAHLCGYQFVDESINDILLSAFLRAYMDEMTPAVHDVNVELERYKEKVVERFGNRMIKDSLARICEDGSSKFFNTQKDALVELIQVNRHSYNMALGFAAFIVYLATADAGAVKDAKKDELIPLAHDAVADPRSTEKCRTFIAAVFGDFVAGQQIFVCQVTAALTAIQRFSLPTVLQKGGTLSALLSDSFRNPAHLGKLLAFALD